MNKIADGVFANTSGILLERVGFSPEPGRPPSLEEEVRRIRVRAARRGGGHRWSNSPAGRAQRVREIERLVGDERRPAGRSEVPVSTERRVLPLGHRYADGLSGS